MATIRQIQDSLKPSRTKEQIGRGRMILSVSEHYNPWYKTAMLLPVFQQPGLPERVFWVFNKTSQFGKDRPKPGDQFSGYWTLYWDPIRERHLIQNPRHVKKGKIELLSTEGEQASDAWYFTAEDGAREWLGHADDLKLSATTY